MNQEVIGQLAESLGLTPAEYNALQAGDPAGLITDQLAGQSLDPVRLMLVSSILRQNSQWREAEETETDREQRLARAKKIMRKQKAALTAAKTMLNYVAEVFGACPACWGQNRLCPWCHGGGQPGSGQPMQEELLAWVEPALAKLGLRIESVEVDRGSTQPPVS